MNNFIIDQCQILFGFENMDFVSVTEMLAQSFWSPGIEIEEVKKGAENSSLLTGAFYNNTQIGYGRTISDKTRFAYILDVYVHEHYRKRGIGQLIINSMLQHDEMKSVYQWFLVTKDAHGMYAKCGFVPLSEFLDPGLFMTIGKIRPGAEKL